jgi:hypothetical protein
MVSDDKSMRREIALKNMYVLKFPGDLKSGFIVPDRLPGCKSVVRRISQF